MMKRFYYGAMATGLVFTACSSDNLSEPGQNGPSDVDKTVYVKMSIHGDVANGTRAANDTGNPVDETDFENGDGTESAVNSAYFVFYDENGIQVGDIVSINLSNAESSVGDGGTVQTKYKSVVPVSIKKGELNPAKVICYINPISPAALQNPLNVIETITRETVNFRGGDGEVYFPMSNSVYYPTEGDGKPQIAVDIAKASLKDSENEAMNAPDAEAIDVYVERYASKLAFSQTKAADSYTTATAHGTLGAPETPVVLDFVAEKWAVNAVANETYVVKSFRAPSESGTILPNDYTYDALNAALNTPKGGTLLDASQAWAWNNANYHRSYWGCSPAYFTAKYPEVASDVENSELHQHYFTYAQLSAGEEGTFDADEEAPQYFRETTVGVAALAGGNPQAAVPSVILVGSYKVTVNGTVAPANSSFYTYISGSNGKPLVFFENEPNSVESEVTDGVSMLERFIEQTSVLYKKDENGGYKALNLAEDKAMLLGALTIERPADAVLKPANTTEGEPMKVPARQHTLQIKEDGNLSGIYIASGNGYKQVVNKETIGSGEISVTDANRILMQQVGFANFYENGHAYFNIPVKHYGWYRAGNPNKDGEAIDWSKVMVGDFGMVRNHSYKVNVTAITGLATGIGGDDDPIVPPADTKDYYVAYKVNILKWAVVPQQNVELK
ncbi:MAG: Mfa1 fimbrilin C-terminal domain-containing protein [Muribaculaceae bacterium]|nr:Mfa1 fimbrilin C-terminal domain-containing protein [Muribaculaceae bacterium]